MQSSKKRIWPKLERFNSVGVSKVGKSDAANEKQGSYLKLCSAYVCAFTHTSPCTPREIPRVHPIAPAVPQESGGSASSASSADVLKPEQTNITVKWQQEEPTNDKGRSAMPILSNKQLSELGHLRQGSKKDALFIPKIKRKTQVRSMRQSSNL